MQEITIIYSTAFMATTLHGNVLGTHYLGFIGGHRCAQQLHSARKYDTRMPLKQVLNECLY